MKHTLTAALAATIFLGGATALALPDWWGFSGHVERVIDGDTFVMDGQRIRLWGIDAPEMAQPYGPQARQALIGLTHERISCKQRDTDRYRRWVSQCWNAAGEDVGISMVAAGYALDYTKYSGGYYKQTQTIAASAKRGMWEGEPINPADWRAQHKKGH